MKVFEVECELCRVRCKGGPEDFVAHCASNDRHKYLESKFQSSKFDYLFASEIGTVADDLRTTTLSSTSQNLMMQSAK
jgi:hypothetical protein